ncbi:hypothetical protein AB0M46_00440 [Dactylosporangium sp. NPDC051485]|uniref:hypothetical protein n=1 Tax=Dactylosporangium sp. NPDC051485 TaxID=3154846 RepID=UPI00341A8ED6
MKHHTPTTIALRRRWHAARVDDRGATSIEWAMFALLALFVAGLVVGAIVIAINNRIPGIN